MSEVSELVNLAVGLLTLGAACWALLRFANRPRLYCGIPPSAEELREKGFAKRTAGRPAVAGAFRHKHTVLGQRLRFGRRKETLSRRDIKRCEDPRRCRTLKRRGDGTVGLPVLVVNAGGRAAASYTANIELRDEEYRAGLHIVDVFTEGLEFGLYTSEPERLRAHARDSAQTTTPPPVIEDYVAYMGEGIGRYGDWVFLWGALDAHSYELIHMDVFVAPEISHFYLIYFVDSADSWMRSKLYLQRVEVAPNGELRPPQATA
jgi:hypothetical protein